MMAFLTALGAASLALLGNFFLHQAQTRSAIRAERRQFVRDMHNDTVGLVVDLDLFVRSIRAAAVTGTGGYVTREEVTQKIDKIWEGDLLARVRRAEYGHPDPDVREAAEGLDDAMWPYIVMAGSAMDEHHFNQDHRDSALREMDAVMVELKRAVYAAPHRQVPAVRYTGQMKLRRIVRAMEVERLARESTNSAEGD